MQTPEIKLRPYIKGQSEPEQGTECVILINGNLYGTAVFENVGYIDAFVNGSYDEFESDFVTHFLPITEIPY